MSRMICFAFVVLLMGACASEAFALGGDHPPGAIAQDYNKEWPKGLPALINSSERVWGQWVNQGDFFYYRGDADAFNAFLASYGTLPSTPWAVVLHAAAKPLAGPLGGEPQIPYDWQVEVMRRGWGPPLDPAQPKNEPGYVVTAHVWLGEAISLDRLVVPKQVEIRSAGEIEQFINSHRAP
ncbi:MAG: hypothetical protein WCJ21_05730 [Planctomycetota bacterium]